jgi:hypothetical protein
MALQGEAGHVEMLVDLSRVEDATVIASVRTRSL